MSRCSAHSPGTFFILQTVVVLATGFAGVGLLVRRAFGLRDLDLDDLLFAFWTGFGTIILLLVWNFVLPVGPATLTLVMAAGTVGLFLSRGVLPAALAEARDLPWWSQAAILGAGLWVANLSLGAMENWDSALYHMQGIEWARHYRAPPGLANLFGPLGFNNSSLLLRRAPRHRPVDRRRVARRQRGTHHGLRNPGAHRRYTTAGRPIGAARRRPVRVSAPRGGA